MKKILVLLLFVSGFAKAQGFTDTTALKQYITDSIPAVNNFTHDINWQVRKALKGAINFLGGSPNFDQELVQFGATQGHARVAVAGIGNSSAAANAFISGYGQTFFLGQNVYYNGGSFTVPYVGQPTASYFLQAGSHSFYVGSGLIGSVAFSILNDGTIRFNNLTGSGNSTIAVDVNGTASRSGLDPATILTTGSTINVSQLTGTLPVAKGGTGTTSPGIVAGTNVTVTGTWPNQTVNATTTGEANTASNIAATVNPNYAGFFGTKSGVNLPFRSLSTPNDAGVQITGMTNEVEIKDNAYDIKGRNTVSTSNATVTMAKHFVLQNGSAGIITVEISCLHSDGASAYTVVKQISFAKASGGTLTLGSEITQKAGELIPTSSNPLSGVSTGFAISANDAEIRVTGLAATTMYWNVTYKVDYVFPNL